MGGRSKIMNATVGKRVKELRKAHGWTQVQLSEKLNKGDSTVRMWELGKSEPDNETIVLLSKLFGVSTDYILGVEPHDDPWTTRESRQPLQPLRRLAAFRARYNVTTTHLGRVLHLDPSMLTHIEKGRKSFSVESLKRACDYMSVTADYLPELPPEAMLSRFITSCIYQSRAGRY